MFKWQGILIMCFGVKNIIIIMLVLDCVLFIIFFLQYSNVIVWFNTFY